MLESRKTKPKKLKITILTISIVGLLLLISRVSFGFWKINVEQVKENIVTSDCFKLNFKETENTDIFLTDAYPLSKSEREELLKTSVPYQFEITNVCDNYASAAINMETIKPEEEKVLQDKWVDVILLNQEQNMEEELNILSSADYKLVSNPESDKKVIEEATKAYELYTFTLRGKETRAFKLYIFMDEETEAKDENMNAAWEGKVTVSLESARMYYVAESGNDETGNGSYGNPYKSIQKAYEEVPSGGVISLLSDLNQSEEIELAEEEKEVIITSHLTSEKKIYEIKREESLKDQAVMHITNKNKVSLTNIKVNGEEIEASKSLIEVEDATLNLEEASAIENGKTTKNGGGISVNNSTLNINGGSVSKNTAPNLGGGVYANGTGTINLNSGNINENTSNFGGGIGIYGVIAFTMNGGNIKGNKVTTSDSNGGGIHIATEGKDGATFEMTGGIIEGNISSGSGAGMGVSANCGEIDVKISGGEFLNNQTNGWGGAINIGNGKKSKVIITGGEFKNNSAGENGGAIMLSSQSAGASTNEITGGLFENNTANNFGGGIYIYSTQPNVINTKISNATFKNNHATSGGGVYISPDIDNCNFEIENVLFDGNTATLKSETTGCGGGIRYYSTKLTNTLTLTNNVITNNESRTGGGICSNGKFILNSGKIEGNRSIYAGGGIAFTDDVDFKMNGGEITKNTAGTYGGGIAAITTKVNSSFNFNGGLVAYNEATSDFGGGFSYYNGEESTINLNGTDFIGNKGTYGGGIHIYVLTNKKVHFTMNQGKIEENNAISGGGLYIQDNGTGTNNIYNVNGGSISKNVATRPSGIDSGGVGGGIRFNTPNDKNIILNLKNVEISNNEATDGGGIFSGSGILNINEKTKINSNSALQYGGGIYAEFGNIYLKGGSIEKNTSINHGGGIYVNKNTKFYMSSGSIINNTCTGTGIGGLYVHTNATEYKKTGGVIDGNLPTNVGGLALN